MFSIVVSNCLVFCFLSLMKRGIGKLQSAVSSHIWAQPRAGVPEAWEANKLQHSIASAVRSKTLCMYAHKRQHQSQCLVHQLTTPGFLTDLSGDQRTCDAEQSAVLFRLVQTGLAQIRLPTLISCEFLNYSPAWHLNTLQKYWEIHVCAAFSSTHKQ